MNESQLPGRDLGRAQRCLKEQRKADRMAGMRQKVEEGGRDGVPGVLLERGRPLALGGVGPVGVVGGGGAQERDHALLDQVAVGHAGLSGIVVVLATVAIAAVQRG